MVVLHILFSANLDNIEEVSPSSSMIWGFKLKCTKCGAVHEKITTVDPSDVVEIEGSRGTANVVQSCKECGQRGSILLIEGSLEPYTKSGESGSVARFEMRGWEPEECLLRDGWTVKSSSSTWENVDLEGGDWGEYDEAAGEGVMIEDAKLEFETVKGSGHKGRRAKK